MDLATTLVVLLVVVAIAGWLVGARDGRALEAFGLGFIGYRSYGWPRGVQEEDPVHFAFAEHGDAADNPGPFGPDATPELIELDGGPDEAIPVRRLR